METPKLIRVVALEPGCIGNGRESVRIREGQTFDIEEGIVGTWFRPVDPNVNLPLPDDMQKRAAKIAADHEAREKYKNKGRPRINTMSEMTRLQHGGPS